MSSEDRVVSGVIVSGGGAFVSPRNVQVPPEVPLGANGAAAEAEYASIHSPQSLEDLAATDGKLTNHRTILARSDQPEPLRAQRFELGSSGSDEN